MIDKYEKILSRAVEPTVETLDALSRRLAEASGPATCTVGRTRVLRDAVREIGEHFCEPGYTVTDLRRAVGGDDWFATLFRHEVGLSPWPLIQECRMEAATRMFRGSALPVADVAFLVGYQAVVPFWRLTKRWCGLSPQAFRTALRRTERRMAGSGLEELADEVFTWHYWERCRRSELRGEEVLALVRHLKAIYPEAAS